MRLWPWIEEILLCPISTILERPPEAQAQQLAAPPTLGHRAPPAFSCQCESTLYLSCCHVAITAGFMQIYGAYNQETLIIMKEVCSLESIV
jgi:hypothetical protein